MPHKTRELRRQYLEGYNAKNKAKIQAQKKAYREANKERLKVKDKAYYEANKDKWYGRYAKLTEAQLAARRKRQSEYEKENSEKGKAYRIAYYEAHKKDILANAAAYKKSHPEIPRAGKAKRRAQKRGAAINDFTAAQWLAMQEAYDHRCVYCGKRAKETLTQDHITPLGKGGNHTRSNIVPACRSCNAKKQTGPPLKPVQPLLLL